ncbi:MAG: 30S ribosomal protein S8, partial [Gammaproteobacteria bacterium]|nr:30S ribosomal protein S8 [Gammaproteobacteria bacterium]NIR98475.1 30S ribosomal protein S8 [Gammaproteobacteria bacterium]NIT64216.1 30S ribosomal protein S8 [Gammaproteobacteria bacterium]NIV21163.1 30S ribosomal protein S8 [Gammaproteobacteria bacterium]NIX10728.1 30S ribosomal protein S8 [Gammaproteobacteria bacterium]
WLTFNSERGLPRILINLKYDETGESVLRGIQRVSRPGLRRQAGYRDIAPVLSGQGVAIVSTSKGVLADYQCREQKVGGEVLCHVW